MSLRNTTSSYGKVTRFFHYTVVILFILNLVIGAFHDIVSDKPLRHQVMIFHKSLGIILFFVAVLFSLWSLTSIKPLWPSSMKKLERFAAKLGHLSLYICLILMPLSGWIMSTASGKAPNFFWLFTFPMPGIPADKALAMTANSVHNGVAWALTIIIGLHFLAAMKHCCICKDGIVSRMWKGTKLNK